MATGLLTDLCWLFRLLPLEPQVIGSGSVRATFLREFRVLAGTRVRPCVVHPVSGLAMVTVLFEDWLEWTADQLLGNREAA
jgi:hypothetical protein